MGWNLLGILMCKDNQFILFKRCNIIVCRKVESEKTNLCMEKAIWNQNRSIKNTKFSSIHPRNCATSFLNHLSTQYSHN